MIRPISHDGLVRKISIYGTFRRFSNPMLPCTCGKSLKIKSEGSSHGQFIIEHRCGRLFVWGEGNFECLQMGRVLSQNWNSRMILDLNTWRGSKTHSIWCYFSASTSVLLRNKFSVLSLHVNFSLFSNGSTGRVSCLMTIFALWGSEKSFSVNCLCFQ